MKRTDRPPLSKPQGAGTILEELLSGAGVAEQLKSYRAWQCWAQVVGPQIATHARPKRLRNGVLEISVDQPIWMQQLRLMAPQILGRLNDALGGELIRELFWRRGTPPQSTDRGPENTSPPKLPPLNDRDKKVISSMVEEIRDSEVRQSLERLLRKQARLQQQNEQQT